MERQIVNIFSIDMIGMSETMGRLIVLGINEQQEIRAVF